MIGAIAGDVIGSVYEQNPAGGPGFRPLVAARACFTDDTVLTVATADAILRGGDYAAAYRAWGNRHPRAGYGGAFRSWLTVPGAGPYNSWGNGSAMRVSPVGWAFDSEDEVLREAARSAAVTHDHPEGIKGAQAVALALFLARGGATKEEIRREIAARFGYDLSRTVEGIRPGYGFHVSCMKSVPEALVAFLDSDDAEHAIRLAVSLGGDADTQAAIAGSVAEAFYGGIPEPVRAPV
ncbi:MAG TPA: ADP-ribosylglycohydrolase family protein, partial [Longimicrobiaceae bacterium]